jgi:type IV pilus assembly protein PilF
MTARLATLLLLSCLAAVPAAAQQSGGTDPGAEAARLNARLGIEYMKQGQLAIAREKIEKALRQNPRDPSVQVSAGIMYEQLREPGVAERHYRQALKLERDNPEVQNALGAFLCRNGEAKEGEAMFLKAARNPLYRTPEVAYTNAGVCARRNGRLDRSEEYLRLAIAQRNPYPEALLQMAGISFERGNFLQSRAFLQRFLAVGSGSADVLLLGYQVEKAMGDEGAADEFAARLRRQFPDSPEARTLDAPADAAAP